ncbi:DUF2514 family protein [Pseudomonas asplenii]|uniref:DUF2514 family protein n=1 Tax=Pseudomonas asplenii TaxID=53407 RepID=UPI003877A7ED
MGRSSTASGWRRCVGTGSCTAGAGEAVARYARVLADVLERADKRAGVLAAAADQSRARGVACEAAYDYLMDGAKMGHSVSQTMPNNAQ